ncbi:MAG: DUF1320 domain-containing protein [Rhodobacteraceae bacterium]|nr:DUF1320 domain-containing protein [Paracoccaceae bacterium]
MAYATRTDIEALYGAQALYVADRDGDGQGEDAAVSRALDDASGEIDAWLRVRYDIPVAPVPQLLVQIACDIALYRLAQTADVRTDEHRTRYDDALATLKRLSRGEMMLPPPPPDPNAPLTLDGPRPIVVTGPERLFSRDKTRDL